MTDALQFDADAHRYTLGGVVVPSVTQIIGPLYNFDGINRDVLEAKAALGTAVHRACELMDADDLDEESDAGRAALEPIAGYLAGYKRFKSDKRPVVLANEQRLFHPVHKYAGTCDRVYGMDGEQIVVDLKTTVAKNPAVGIQLAAYAELFRANGKSQSLMKRYALQLKPDGSYKLHSFVDLDDWTTFLSLLNVYRWKARHEK